MPRLEVQALSGAAEDYDGLLDLIGDASIVLIGEASHGTHEFYRERALITRRLIEEKGFGAGDELRFALAGPAVTLAIAMPFGAIALALPPSAPAGLRAVIEYQAFINAAILAFNLLPAFPLDGGRVARALIWGRIGDLTRATAVAASIGRGFGWGMIGPAFQRVGRAVVLTTNGGVGILSITDVNRALRALDLQKAARARARSA